MTYSLRLAIEETILTFYAWIVVNVRYYPAFIYNTLIKQAWNDGFYAAYLDIAAGQANQFCCTKRLSIQHYASIKHAIPELFYIDSRTMEAWDNGYHRAILLYRLGIYLQPTKQSRWTYSLPIEADAIAVTIEDGDLRPDPRVFKKTNGDVDELLSIKRKAIEECYKQYSVKLNEIRSSPIK